MGGAARNDPKKISWTVNLKADLGRGKRISLSPKHSAHGMYRPFNKQWLYFDRSLIERVLQMPKLFPKPGIENTVISVTGVGASKGFSALIVSVIPNLHLHDTGQCFPLYVYEEAADGGTDWATTDGTVVDG